MKHRAVCRRKCPAHSAIIAVVFIALITPVTQRIVVDTLVEVAGIPEKIVQFPCWLIDHLRNFSLDRLDPTCPQCIQPFD